MTVHLRASDTVVLFVRDLELSAAFYSDKLGMELQDRDRDSAMFRSEHGIVMLLSRDGAVDLLGDNAVAFEPADGASCVLVATVDDVDTTYEALSDRGVEFLRPPEDRWWGRRTAHFRDPDGHVWEIHQDAATK